MLARVLADERPVVDRAGVGDLGEGALEKSHAHFFGDARVEVHVDDDVRAALSDPRLSNDPHHAGAAPGPACYGRGGTLATVTDANLLLGRIDPAGAARTDRGPTSRPRRPVPAHHHATRRRGVAPNLLYRWRRLMTEGGAAAVGSDEPVVGSSEVRRLEDRIRDLERLLGRPATSVEEFVRSLA